MNINDLKDFSVEKVENKKLCSFTIDTYIHDVNLSSKVNDKLKSLNLSPDADKIYSIDVYFDKKVYGEVEFYSFPVERKQWQIEKLEKLDTREKQKNIIGQVLSAQLQNVCNEIRKFNFNCRNIRIIGDELGNLNQVKIKITEDNVTKQRESIEASSKKSKKNNTIHTVATIVPDQPYIVEKATEVIADLFLRKIKEEGLKEFEKSKHTPNLISTKQVFISLANALITEFPDKYTSSELVVKELLSQATLKNDWPLEIVSKETYSTYNELGNEIDCPEYLIYIKKRHCWTFKKINDLDTAKRIILTEGYNRKFVDEIIVLHNLNPIKFDLFVENSGEISPISKVEAHTAKKLLLSWKK